MSLLLWPGDQRAGELMSDAAVLAAMLAVESAWLRALVGTGLAPAKAGADLDGLLGPADVEQLAAAAEGAGNPVLPALALLRERVGARAPAAATWLHRGLTSQDVLDTALMLCARAAVDAIDIELKEQITALADLAVSHVRTPMLGRTLTQPAVRISFGAKVGTWHRGVLDAAEDLRALTFPAQIGGAAGTLSGAVALAEAAGHDKPVDTARELVTRMAATLGLAERPPWHTARAPITRIGSAFTGCSAAWGRIANDVLTLTRPEIGEVTEPVVEGRGGSSTMPQKANPVLSVLIRRAALSAPAHLSLLNLAAADTGDERPAGAWHVEWEPFALLARHTVTAARQATELIAGLQIDAAQMQTNLDAHHDDVSAESDALTRLANSGHSNSPEGR